MSEPSQIAGSLRPAALLQWYLEAGVDETIGEIARNRLIPVQREAPLQREASPRALESHTSAHIATSCANLAELKSALEAFDGCALKRTCQRTVFADGNPEARVMLLGEAPGAEEDKQGLPFVGPSGHLLDRMLKSIGLDRASVYITNVVPWRPPGNRKPEPAEVELCLPFTVRHIELVDPVVIVVLGGAAAAALLARTDSITRLRGRWHEFASQGLARPVPVMPTFHPAYLLRTPLQKREAWRDLLAVQKRLASIL